VVFEELAEGVTAKMRSPTILPLTPFVPKRRAAKLADMAFSYGELLVGRSNVGRLDPAVARIDGTDAEWFSLRLMEQGVRRRSLERIRGQLFLASGRILGKVFITVAAYHVGR
jgi:hypothetical protein